MWPGCNRALQVALYEVAHGRAARVAARLVREVRCPPQEQVVNVAIFPAVAVGYASIGVEKDPTYYSVAERAIPALARLTTIAQLGGKRAFTQRTQADSHR